MKKDNIGQEARKQKIQEEVVTEGAPVSDPKIEKETQAYLTGLSKMLHGRDTSGQVIEILKSAPPDQSIPQAALTVNSQMEGAVREAGQEPSLEVLLNAGIFLVNDLVEMGNAAGIFQLEGEAIGPILQSTLKQYIEKGLAEGTIDPVELQEKVGPLMDEEHTALGTEAAALSGIPQEPNEGTAMQAYGAKMQKKGMMQGQGGR